MILYLIGLVIGGLVVGALGRLLHPGRDDMSIPLTIGLGVVSMVIAGIVFRALLGVGGGFITSVLVAVVLVYFWSRSRAAGHT